MVKKRHMMKIVVRFEVFAAATMKNAVFCDDTPRGSCENRRFVGTSVLTKATGRNISEDGILDEDCCSVGCHNLRVDSYKHSWEKLTASVFRTEE
jgi:hypothetical protein